MSWYFRLNGFLSIPGYIVHPDRPAPFPRTEADLMAVRFPYSVEKLNNLPMKDDPKLTRLARHDQFFVLVEVKADRCEVNGPWSRKREGNMQRAIDRLGFIEESKVGDVAEEMYQSMRWEDNNSALQYVTVGKHHNDELGRRYANLVQVTYKEIGRFLYSRFKEFPQKLGTEQLAHPQWPLFGRAYDDYSRAVSSRRDSERAVQRFIDTGSLCPS